MHRRLFHVLAAVSFAALLATEYVRVYFDSHSWQYSVARRTGPFTVVVREAFAYSDDGIVMVGRSTETLDEAANPLEALNSTEALKRPQFHSNRIYHGCHGLYLGPSCWNRLGFTARSSTFDRPGCARDVAYTAFPHRLVSAITGVLPVVWLIGLARVALRRKVALRWRLGGFCERCGYDMRASVDRCPECGTPAPSRLGSELRMAPEGSPP